MARCEETAYHRDKGTENNMPNLIPYPATVNPTEGQFKLTTSSQILTDLSHETLSALANHLAEQLQHRTGARYSLANTHDGPRNIRLRFNDKTDLGEEGYELSITENGTLLTAPQPAGVYYGIQTFLQLIPTPPNGPISLPAVSIRDTPRFAWRGAMLDVVRHFFSVQDVKRYIDLISHYKMNRLHLHLTDDQGWRIEIKSWPRLTEYGGQTQVGGGRGGFYTQEQYREIVAYAASRFVTIVPEIDTPGHTNAALASYAELNCDGQAPTLYEGTEVGFSSLCINKEITYTFLEDVIRELAAITPGPCIHIGGDEAKSTPEDDYKTFIKRMQEIVRAHGKTPIGWAEIGEAQLLPGTIAQHWIGTSYQEAKAQGAKIILSPANKTYLDMKYDPSTTLGLDWVGYTSVKDSYDWEPGGYMHLLEETDILGLEAPIWTETLPTMKDLEYLAFPRLPGLAELAWSPKGMSWQAYKQRLAAHGRQMDAMGINFFRSPDVDWV